MTPMRILLIMPDAHMHKLRLGPFTRSFREAPLTLTTLAALAPPGPGVEIKLVDGSVDAIPLNYPADLVGISVITGCARPAYALAAHFRRRGIPVVWAVSTSPSCRGRPCNTRTALSSGAGNMPGHS